jgi:hypothetical protein
MKVNEEKYRIQITITNTNTNPDSHTLGSAVREAVCEVVGQVDELHVEGLGELGFESGQRILPGCERDLAV